MKEKPEIYIGIDCDGVLGDFTGHCLEKVRMMGEPSPKTEDIIEYRIEKFLSPEQVQYMYSALKQKNFWANLPLIPGAQDAIAEIKYFGFNVLYVTAAWGTCPDWQWLRADWLKRYFDANEDDIIICRKKGHILVDAMIDDYDKNIRDFVTKQPGKTAFLMAQPWNSNSSVVTLPNVCRVDWNEIISVLPDLAYNLGLK